MDLKNMELPKKKENDIMESEVAAPQYPYGLRIYLDKESLSRLGVDSLPELKAKMKLEAMVEVVSVSENQSIYGDSKNVDLQIVEMALGEDKE